MKNGNLIWIAAVFLYNLVIPAVGYGLNCRPLFAGEESSFLQLDYALAQSNYTQIGDPKDLQQLVDGLITRIIEDSLYARNTLPGLKPLTSPAEALWQVPYSIPVAVGSVSGNKLYFSSVLGVESMGQASRYLRTQVFEAEPLVPNQRQNEASAAVNYARVQLLHATLDVLFLHIFNSLIIKASPAQQKALLETLNANIMYVHNSDRGEILSRLRSVSVPDRPIVFDGARVTQIEYTGALLVQLFAVYRSLKVGIFEKVYGSLRDFQNHPVNLARPIPVVGRNMFPSVIRNQIASMTGVLVQALRQLARDNYRVAGPGVDYGTTLLGSLELLEAIESTVPFREVRRN